MTLIYFILILGVVVFVHELGHYIFAKRAGIYVYEFAIGMGPRVFSKKFEGNETVYSLRLIPIGGFVSMAGEEVHADENIPPEKRVQNKTWMQRFLTIISGVVFNFIFAILLLFVIGLFNGAPETRAYLGDIPREFPVYEAGLREGDLITEINGERIRNWDQITLTLAMNQASDATFTYENESGTHTVTVTPIKEEDRYIYGLVATSDKHYGLIPAASFAVNKTIGLFEIMIVTLKGLFTGQLSINNLAGPVGIYTIVGDQAEAGLFSLLYMVAFLSINIGFINLIPFPAFDGGRLLFLIIEKIKGSPVKPEIENRLHYVGFILLMLLLVYVTWNDIMRIFN